MKSTTLYLLDASVFIFKAYFTMPAEYVDQEGRAIETFVGFMNGFLRFLQKEQPVYLAAAFDESLFSGFRHEIYPDYKANRELPDDALAYQLKLCKEGGEALGIKTFASQRFEADDIIASLAALAKKEHFNVVVLSADKDLGQLLLTDHDYLLDYQRNKKMARDDIERHFHVKPEQLADYLALAGDAVDGIPGVKGIGKKTAADLLNEFETIENMYRQLNDVELKNFRSGKRIKQTLLDSCDAVKIFQQLTRLSTEFEHNLDNVEALRQGDCKPEFFESLGLIPMANKVRRLTT